MSVSRSAVLAQVNLPNLDIKTGIDSIGIKGVYTQGGVLTVFDDLEAVGEAVDYALKNTMNCFKFDFGHRDNEYHNDWHQSASDFGFSHYHLIKREGQLTKADIKCMLRSIREFEVENNACLDGKTDCLLSDEDVKQFERQLAGRPSATSHQGVFSEIKRQGLVGAQAFLHAFLSTFLSNYIIPSLISAAPEKRLSNGTIFLIQTTLQSIIDYFTTLNIAAMAMGLVTSKAFEMFKFALKRMNLKQRDLLLLESLIAPLQTITTTLNVVSTASKAPLTLFSGVVTTSSASLGYTAAYKIINRLPKLKQEDLPKLVTPAAEVVGSSPEGLRRRIGY